MATHSSILAWRIPWTEESGGLQYSPQGRKESDTTERLTLSHLPCKVCKFDSVHRSHLFIFIFVFIAIALGE